MSRGRGKLQPSEYIEMRRRYHAEGWTQARLARHYGLSAVQVGRIVRGESQQALEGLTEAPEVISPEDLAASIARVQEMAEKQRVKDAEAQAPEAPKAKNKYY